MLLPASHAERDGLERASVARLLLLLGCYNVTVKQSALVMWRHKLSIKLTAVTQADTAWPSMIYVVTEKNILML